MPILHSRISFKRLLLIAALTAAAVGCRIAAASVPSVADLDASARAAGNRIDVATHIGESVFATKWPAQVSQISANEVSGHLIVGVRIWGVKFHEAMTRQEFVDEVAALAGKAFAAAPNAEEVDVWASVPIAVAKGEIVSGDLAVPTSRTVFSVSAHRGESGTEIVARASSATGGAYWDEEWARAAFEKSASSSEATASPGDR